MYEARARERERRGMEKRECITRREKRKKTEDGLVFRWCKFLKIFKM